MARRRAELAWVLFWLLCLVAIVMLPRWEPVAFYLIWISLALLYGFRNWPPRGTSRLLAAVVASTAAAIGLNVLRGLKPAAALSKVALVAGLFCAMAWHAHRRLAADTERGRVSERNASLLATSRRFAQDASHQLRTPITIALGHAELLARELAGQHAEREIHVVVGELNRLRSLSERLLLIAASENPDFLRPEPVALDQFAIEVLRRWRPAARRCWQLGQLDHVTVSADRDRLSLAVDALLENAVQHTATYGAIRLSVARDGRCALASLTVEDAGPGIPQAELAHIFDRFATGSGAGGRRGTGLGLPIVLAIIRGHGGEVRVHSTPGAGSRFELLLPVLAQAADGPPADRLPAAAAALSASGSDRPGPADALPAAACAALDGKLRLPSRSASARPQIRRGTE
jgi:signal transduction histidine kinase